MRQSLKQLIIGCVIIQLSLVSLAGN